MFRNALLIATATTFVLGVLSAAAGPKYELHSVKAVEALEKRVADLENAATAAQEPGPPGPSGPHGTTGLDSRIKITTLEVGDEDCPFGGIKLEAGLDDNRSGALDTPQEVDDTAFVCNG